MNNLLIDKHVTQYNWELKKIKYLFEQNKSQITPEELEDREVVHYSIPNAQEFGLGKLENGFDIQSNKFITEKEQLLVSKLNPRKETICITRSHERLAICSTEFISLIKRFDELATEYFYYLFLSRGSIQLLDSMVESVTNSYQRIQPDKFNDLYVCYPNFEEQKLISRYIDRKTKQIDSLTEKIQKTIKLFKEQRTSLINQRVTKGLDPNVEMKDSRIEWISEIPRHWEVKRLKFLANHISSKHLPLDGEIKISPENVESHTGKINNYFSEYDTEGQEFIEGDILFNKLRVYLNKVVLCDFKGLSMGEMIVIRPVKITNGFLYRVLNSQNFIDQVDFLSEGVKLPRPPVEGIMNSFIPVPTTEEQKLISKYLDKKTEQIDSLIGKIQKKIELLKEQRTSLINQSVTKGLDSNVETKDSGIEWIGEIPKHWEVIKIGYLSRLETGNTPSKSNEDLYFTEEDQDFPWVKPSDLNNGIYGVSSTETRLTELGKQESRVVPKNSILVCCIGNTSGKYSISNRDVSTNQQINSITFNEDNVIPRYGLYFVDVFGRDLLKWMHFVTLPIISKGDLSQHKIIVPPVLEQRAIVKKLDETVSIIDKIIKTEDKRIKFLGDYRQSLISSVVTGKVRITKDMV